MKLMTDEELTAVWCRQTREKGRIVTLRAIERIAMQRALEAAAKAVGISRSQYEAIATIEHMAKEMA